MLLLLLLPRLRSLLISPPLLVPPPALQLYPDFFCRYEDPSYLKQLKVGGVGRRAGWVAGWVGLGWGWVDGLWVWGVEGNVKAFPSGGEGAMAGLHGVGDV